MTPAGYGLVERAAARRAFRAFVRAQHPDRGGDPAVFAAGVTAYRRSQQPPGRAGPAVGHVVFYRRRRGLAVLVGYWLDRRARRRRPPRVL